MVSESKKVREILFRGQTRKFGQKVNIAGEKLPGIWVYGGVLQGVGCHSIIYGGKNENDPGEGLEKWVVYTDTLGQFTGLTDKNGKKIFEGDIVRYVYEPAKGFWNCNQNSVIKWREPGWYMEGIKGTNKYALMCGYLSTVPYAHDTNERGNVKVFEVIGNIYDNPELLEGHDG